jgi:hypothetical protein
LPALSTAIGVNSSDMSAHVFVLTPWTGEVPGQFSLLPLGPMYTGT